MLTIDRRATFSIGRNADIERWRWCTQNFHYWNFTMNEQLNRRNSVRKTEKKHTQTPNYMFNYNNKWKSFKGIIVEKKTSCHTTM